MSLYEETFSCPNCDGEVRQGAKACPHCGSDKNTGWSDQSWKDGLGIYDEDDYNETIEREFKSGREKPGLKQTIYYITAILTVLVFIKVFIGGC